MGNVKFNGTSSKDLDIIIQTKPVYTYPEKDISETHIPGRNGNLVIDNKSFNNVQRSYNFALIYKNEGEYIQKSEIINNWLHSSGAAYSRLEDTYDPDVYRMARYSESKSFTDVNDGAVTISVNFECMPQRFLKSGDNPITFNTATVELQNPGVYESLPLIEIINGSEVSTADILLMTLTNYLNDVTSVISLKTDDDHIYIDSDTQNCYTPTEDINYKIGLNGKDFPKLEQGTNTLKLEKFTQQSFRVSQYTKVISDAQTICKAEYKSKDILITEQEQKIYVKPYTAIINQNQKSFSAQSYQAYMMSLSGQGVFEENDTVADMYTFTSINKMLESVAIQFSVLGNISDNPELANQGNGYIRAVQNDDKLEVFSTISGYFLVSSEKLIKLVSSGTKLASISGSSSVTINYYPTTNNKIDISYDDIPNWLKFEIVYSTTDGVTTPTKVYYKSKLTGTYWIDKQWAFGKAKWVYLDTETILTELSWNNLKRAFMPKQGITTSTNTSFTFRYIARTIQYPSSEESPSYITVVRPSSPASGSDDFIQIKLKTMFAGYYSYQLNDNATTRTKWLYKNSNADLATLSGTDAFQVYYLKDIPDYSTELEWPDWLDPHIIPNPADDYLNTKTVKFKVLKQALYRYSYIDTANENAEKFTDWVAHNVNDILDFAPTYKKTDEGFYICMLESMPEEYTNDRAYTVNDGPTTATPPAWLNVSITQPSDELPNGEIQYSANATGYYKWDTNSVWMKKNRNDALLTSGIKDETILYFMNELPEYDTDERFKITHIEDSTGNPNSVIITIKIAGYYRVNYDSDWTYFKVGDTLYEATSSEEVRISYLISSENQLDSVTIKVTPRWWIL